jgi:hypothetical protein
LIIIEVFKIKILFFARKFRLQRLLQQALGAVKWNMSSVQTKNTSNILKAQKDDMIAELFMLMPIDGDI